MKVVELSINPSSVTDVVMLSKEYYCLDAVALSEKCESWIRLLIHLLNKYLLKITVSNNVL